MFIELAEHLRCPADHPEAYCVLAPEEMDGRDVVRGTVGCPACRREYSIEHGVVAFGSHPLVRAGDRSDDVLHPALPDESAAQALLSLDSPGGYVVLLGSASRLAAKLAALVEGVHVIGVNVPPDVHVTPTMSVLTAPSTIPLRTSVARGVVVPAEFATNPWLRESARVIRRGARVVCPVDAEAVPELRQVASAPNLWLGERT